ncbi:hypothetical protein GCM10027271_52210 [Saccharopolyspora gloriosae]
MSADTFGERRSARRGPARSSPRAGWTGIFGGFGAGGEPLITGIRCRREKPVGTAAFPFRDVFATVVGSE